MATELNGRLKASALALIDGTNKRFRAELVPQTNALRAAFAAHFGKPLAITDAYRPYEEQVYLRQVKGVWAAVPGTSNHGWGRAIDFGSNVNIEGSAEYRWMKEHAETFGFVHPKWAWDNDPRNGQQEPWHWEATYVPASRYISITPPAPSTPSPLPIQEDDDVAKIIQRGSEPTIYLSAPALGVHYPIANEEELHELEGYYGKSVSLGARQFDVRRQAALSVKATQEKGFQGFLDRIIASLTRIEAAISGTRGEIAKVMKELQRIGTRLKEITIAPAVVRDSFRRILGTEATQAAADAGQIKVAAGSTVADIEQTIADQKK